MAETRDVELSCPHCTFKAKMNTQAGAQAALDAHTSRAHPKAR